MAASGFLRRAVDHRLKPYVRMLVRVEVDQMRSQIHEDTRSEIRSQVSSGLSAEMRSEVAAQLHTSPVVWAKIIPADEDREDLVVLGRDNEATPGDDGLPVPPPGMWELPGYRSGPEHVDSMRAILARAGCDLTDCGPVLDSGCGSGRMIRCLGDVAQNTEVWGVDINAESIAWCQANLSPPFHFVTSTTMPSLPFEDRTFGLVYAGSVFSHISELAETWLAELRRITRPGGYLYITVQDQAYIEAALALEPRHWTGDKVHDAADLLDRLGKDVSMVSLGRASKNAMVFHDRSSLVESWGRFLEVVEVVDRAWDIQTAVVLRRRPDA